MQVAARDVLLEVDDGGCAEREAGRQHHAAREVEGRRLLMQGIERPASEARHKNALEGEAVTLEDARAHEGHGPPGLRTTLEQKSRGG